MIFKVTLSETDIDALKTIWGVPEHDDIIEVTAFGDFFTKSPSGEYTLYCLTDGEIKSVTAEVKEHGLPPVEIALGDEWYQLDAQNMLKEAGEQLGDHEVFAFTSPVFLGGEYGPDNVSVENICLYSRRIHGLMHQNKT